MECSGRMSEGHRWEARADFRPPFADSVGYSARVLKCTLNLLTPLAQGTAVPQDQAEHRGQDAHEEHHQDGISRVRHPRLPLEPVRVAHPPELCDRTGGERATDAPRHDGHPGEPS